MGVETLKLEKLIRSGDEVRCSGSRYDFVAKFWSFSSDDVFSIKRPSANVKVKPGDQFLVSCITEAGIYNLETVVIEPEEPQSPNDITMRITRCHDLIQRRDTFRVRESIPVEICKRGEFPDACQWVETETLDISESGMFVKFKESCEPGQPVKINMHLNLYGVSDDLSNLRGTVVRCVRFDKKKHGYFLGIKFVDLPTKARNEIIKIVMFSQRDRLSRLRLPYFKRKEAYKPWE